MKKRKNGRGYIEELEEKEQEDGRIRKKTKKDWDLTLSTEISLLLLPCRFILNMHLFQLICFNFAKVLLVSPSFSVYSF